MEKINVMSFYVWNMTVALCLGLHKTIINFGAELNVCLFLNFYIV